MSSINTPLRLNVGFIVHQSIGYSRDFIFEIQKIHLPPDLSLNNLEGTARITRTPQGLLLQVKMNAAILAECVRCLTQFEQHLEVDFTELYAFSPRSVTDSGLIMPEDGIIDLTPVLREYMMLEIPISPLCKPNCKGLCPICGENLNDTTCHHEEEVGDPRLAILRKFLDKE